MRYTVIVETYRSWHKRYELEWKDPEFEYPPKPDDGAIIYKDYCAASSESILFDRALPYCLKPIRKRIDEINDEFGVHKSLYGMSLREMKINPWRSFETLKRIEVLDEKGETVIGWGEWWEGKSKSDKT